MVRPWEALDALEQETGDRVGGASLHECEQMSRLAAGAIDDPGTPLHWLSERLARGVLNQWTEDLLRPLALVIAGAGTKTAEAVMTRL